MQSASPIILLCSVTSAVLKWRPRRSWRWRRDGAGRFILASAPVVVVSSAISAASIVVVSSAISAASIVVISSAISAAAFAGTSASLGGAASACDTATVVRTSAAASMVAAAQE